MRTCTGTRDAGFGDELYRVDCSCDLKLRRRNSAGERDGKIALTPLRRIGKSIEPRL